MTLTRRALCLGLTALAAPGFAAPQNYALDPNASTVGFTFLIDGLLQTGTMPVARADLRVDPTDLAASQVDVEVLAARARTGLIFATQALKSPQVLDVDRFPRIRFVSTSVKLSQDDRISDGARITGDLTIRSVTRPVSLQAALFRPVGSAPDDLRTLTVTLAGSVSRSAFGAVGYAGLVDDQVGLDIRAVIAAVT